MTPLSADQGAQGIGVLPFPFPSFSDLDAQFAAFQTDTFQTLPVLEKLHLVFASLLEKIQDTQTPTFLLPAVINYLERVNTLQIIGLPVSFALFEFWLNHFAKLSLESQARVRGKIAGKDVPREEYGHLFPISLGKVHPGSHFVSAHLSPDLDTTVASFIGWLDAFAARVGTGQHLWNLPGGPTQAQIEGLFSKLFGNAFFELLAHTDEAMRLTAMDLLTREAILYAEGPTSLTHLDHDMGNTAILYVDAKGYYQGDWRGSNFEPVEQITTLFDRVLRAFAHLLHVDLLALFAQPQPPQNHLESFYKSSFSKSLLSVLQGLEESSPYQQRLNLFCKKVLSLEEGLDSSFHSLFERFNALAIPEVSLFLNELKEQTSVSVWPEGSFDEKRIHLFQLLYRLVHALDKAVDAMSHYVDRLDVVMRIKHDVLGYQPSFAMLNSDLETLRLSLGDRDYLTIVLVDAEGRRIPLGVVPATTLRKEILGTVSQRDFSNPDEMRMPSYLTVISVMDHHKSVLQTRAPIQALLSDAQSCNVLVAEGCFYLNDRYSTGGILPDKLAGHIGRCMSELSKEGAQNTEQTRLLQRYLQKSEAAQNSPYYVHPLREYIEYFYCLHAILDDTDLLSKVGVRDVACAASLLRRLKTLCTGEEADVVSLDDLPKTQEGARQAAARLLNTPELHALYMQLYKQREQEVESALRACAQEADLSLFADTKQQNGCCRIGQIKLFPGNQETYRTYEVRVRAKWLEESEAAAKQTPEYALHLMMISTLTKTTEDHREIYDSLWIWTPPTSVGLGMLARFLNAFQTLNVFQKYPPTVALYGKNSKEWQELFTQNFKAAPSIQMENQEDKRTYAIIHYPCGAVNSRKTMISPFLPTLAGSNKNPWG